MTFRTMLLTAAIIVPLAFDSNPVTAQDPGAERAAVATTQSNGAEQRQDEAPPGVIQRFAAGLMQVMPEGIRRRFSYVEPEPEPEPVPEPVPTPEPEPEPEPEPCVPTFGYQNGVPGTFDCNGVFTPFGG